MIWKRMLSKVLNIRDCYVNCRQDLKLMWKWSNHESQSWLRALRSAESYSIGRAHTLEAYRLIPVSHESAGTWNSKVRTLHIPPLFLQRNEERKIVIARRRVSALRRRISASSWVWQAWLLLRDSHSERSARGKAAAAVRIAPNTLRNRGP